MAIRKTEGIILSGADWSESSQTLTVFTPDKGKLTLTVRGSRKLLGKRGRPMRFARLEFTCYLRDDSERGYLADVEPVEVFLFERDGQLGRLAFASAALELLDNLLTALDPQTVVYQITLSFLRMTDRIEKKRLPGLFAGYILRLVSLLGFRPNLIGCVGCGTEMVQNGSDIDDRKQYTISIERGGLICENCRRSMPGENRLISLPGDIHGKLILLMGSSLEEASRVMIPLQDLNRMVDLLVTLLRFHAGTIRPLKSFDFLDKLARAVKTYGG